LSSSCAEAPEPAEVTSTSASRSTPVALGEQQRLADGGGVGGAERVVDQLDHLALAELAGVDDQRPHRLEQRADARAKSSSRAPPAMIVSVPVLGLGEEPVTGASSIATPCSPSASPMRRVSSGPIVEQSTHSRPGRAAR
jgi:hypothetical protein